MSNTKAIRTAVVTEVKIGILSIEGIQFTDTDNIEFGIAVPQMVALNLVPPNRSKKQLESLIGMGFQSHQKAKTELNPKPVNTIGILDFEVLLAKLDRKGNVVAQDFRDSLVGLALHQLFCDAFNLKFEKEDRQNWLLTRQGTKFTFRTMTDSLKEFGFKDGKDYGNFVYTLQTKLGIETGSRNFQDTKTLQNLLIAQTQIQTGVKLGLTPWQALELI